jgi:hypothetical protein
MSRLLALMLLLASPALAQDIVAIESRTLVFEPTRDDLTVGTVWFNIYASQPSQVTIDGVASAEQWHHLELREVAKNRFALPALRIESRATLLCLSIKVWFKEVGNQHDGLFYERLDDRYALVAFATRADGPEWERARPRFAQNRVATLDEFLAALERPFALRLNRRPLAEAR